MKKLIYGFFVSFLLIIILCVGLWLWLASSVVSYINANYAGKNLGEYSRQIPSNYKIQFSHVEVSGFPFDPKLNLHGIEEEGPYSKINYQNPLQIGYNFTSQSLFFRYQGEILAHYKPLNSGFGSKIINQGASLDIKLPLSIKLLKTLRQINDENFFRIINFIDHITVSSKETKIYDLVDNQEIYNSDHFLLKIIPNKINEYDSLNDLLNNLPPKIEVVYSDKVTSSIEGRRISPVGILLLKLPISYSCDTNFTIETNSKRLDDLKNHLVVNINKFAFDNSLLSINLKNSLYKIDILNTNNKNINYNSKIAANGNLTFKPNFFIKFFSSLVSRLKDNKNSVNFLESLSSKLNWQILEGNSYDVKLSTVLSQHNTYLQLAIDSGQVIMNNDIGFNITGKYDFNNIYNASLKGVSTLYNYSNLVDFIIKLYNFPLLTNLPKETKGIVVDAAKHFLHNISDNKSDKKTKDITVSYDINTNNLLNAKFGNVRITELQNIYISTLYKELTKQYGVDKILQSQLHQILPNMPPELQKQLQKYLSTTVSPDVIPQKLEKNLKKILKNPEKILDPKKAKKELQKLIPKLP